MQHARCCRHACEEWSMAWGERPSTRCSGFQWSICHILQAVLCTTMQPLPWPCLLGRACGLLEKCCIAIVCLVASCHTCRQGRRSVTHAIAVAAALMMAAASAAPRNQGRPVAAAGLCSMCQLQPEHPLTAGAALGAYSDLRVHIMPSRSCSLPALGCPLHCVVSPATVGVKHAALPWPAPHQQPLIARLLLQHLHWCHECLLCSTQLGSMHCHTLATSLSCSAFPLSSPYRPLACLQVAGGGEMP